MIIIFETSFILDIILKSSYFLYFLFQAVHVRHLISHIFLANLPLRPGRFIKHAQHQESAGALI
jgi:hypothetical protein